MLSCVIKSVLSKQFISAQKNVRTFLSGAYSCNEIWEQRKRAKIFQKIDYDDLYHQLDRSFQIGHRISVLDVDLFASGIDSDLFQNELEDILFKLRLNPETGLVSERTMHAVAKYYMKINKKQNLIDILNNRLSYGIFMDYYIANILMDSFLKEKEFTSAAKIAVLQMLQEDFNHPILRLLSIYSCMKYLKCPEIWSPPKEEEEKVEDDEDEEVRVRVSFIRNPYFDDHFDLVDTNHLIGKTLHLAGEALPGPIGISSRLVGLVLHEKFDECRNLLKSISNPNEIYEDAVKMAIEYTKAKPKQPEGSATEAVKTPTVDAALKAMEELLNKNSTLKDDFEGVLSAAVIDAVKISESKDIQSLSKLYRDWEKEREEHIQFEIFESNKRKAAQEIENVKDQLLKQEEVIFYFDKEDEWNQKVQEKLEEQRILAEEGSKTKKKDKEEEYIPPEISQRR